MFCPECGQKIPENSKFCPMCGLNINEFYKNKYSNKNENEKDTIKKDLTKETKEEKARRFEEILKNAGNFQRNEEEVESFEILNNDKRKSEEKNLEPEEPLEEIDKEKVIDEVVNEKIFDEVVEKNSDELEDEKVFEEAPRVEEAEEVSEEEEDSQEAWEEESLNRAKEYMESPEEDGSSVDLKATFAEINFKIMKTIFNPLKSFMGLLERPKGFYKDFFIILSTLFILVTNTDVIRKSSPTQTLSVNRFLITIVVSVFALGMITLKPYLIMTFDKWNLVKEVEDQEKFSKIITFAVVNSVMRLLFYILVDFVPGIGIILGYGIKGESLLFFILFMILESIILQGILMDKWKNKRDLKNLALSSAVVLGVELLSIIVFRPIVTMMISKL